jgi:prepilin-type processing-associated H-X9-DG protein
MDGKPLIASGHKGNGGGFSNPYGVYYLYTDSIMQIIVDEQSYQLWFEFKFNSAIGVYDLYIDTTLIYPYISGAEYNGLSNANDRVYNSDPSHTGTVNVLYFDGNIISGTFSFDLADTTLVSHFTNGEFDIGTK